MREEAAKPFPVEMREEAAKPLPDNLRCNRTNGRQWRCSRLVMDDKKPCEVHYLQGKHRQNKEKVPESLKLERSRRKSCGKSPVVTKLKIRAQKRKKRKLGKELTRMLVEREVEKRREVRNGETVGDGVNKEEEMVDMMRRLPHGVMVISQSPVGKKNGGLNDQNGGNVVSLHDVRFGENGDNLGSRRRFRSKNLEPLPLGMVQVLLCKRNLENGISRKRCHWHKRGNSSNLTKCSMCKKLFYCMECITERNGYFRMANPASQMYGKGAVLGKYSATFFCWILGFGSLVSWSSMLTIGDYYYQVFPKYHPSRVLALVYLPFAICTIALLAYHESKIDTRKRNIIGYILFTTSTFLLIILDLATSGKGGVGPYIGICALVACFGVADAHVQGGMVGDLSFTTPEFMQSFFAGLAASGALTSGLPLITKAAFENANDGLRKGTRIPIL